MNAFRSRLPETALTSTATGEAGYMRTHTDVFAKVRDHDRSEVLAAAREADVLPYFHLLDSPAMPVVEMEGATRIMLGSNNYLGLTGDERVLKGAEDALHRYGTGLTGSQAAQRHDPAAPRTRARDRRVDGRRGGTRLQHRPPGQRRHPRHPARARGHRGGGFGRPRLDPRRMPALAGQAEGLPAQPPGQAREDARPGGGRRRRGAGGRGRGLLDGGRSGPLARDHRAVRALRRPPDGGRGPRGRRARSPRGAGRAN